MYKSSDKLKTGLVKTSIIVGYNWAFNNILANYDYQKDLGSTKFFSTKYNFKPSLMSLKGVHLSSAQIDFPINFFFLKIRNLIICDNLSFLDFFQYMVSKFCAILGITYDTLWCLSQKEVKIWLRRN